MVWRTKLCTPTKNTEENQTPFRQGIPTHVNYTAVSKDLGSSLPKLNCRKTTKLNEERKKTTTATDSATCRLVEKNSSASLFCNSPFGVFFLSHNLTSVDIM